MSRVGWYDHPLLTLHDTGTEHPERPARVRVLREMIETSGLGAKLVHAVSDPASLADLRAVHASSWLDALAASATTSHTRFDVDTVASERSWEAARCSAGGAVQAAEAVLAGTLDTAFVLTRPPGHHAEADHAMGFCLLNNIAIAARAVQARGLARRVAIVDWDVHHGNGTQDIFYDDPNVLYVSTHQFPFYPGTGAASETGSGPGTGTTLNIPLAAGQNDAAYFAAFEQVILPKLTVFGPDVVLVSAGFDAHERDPLAEMRLSGAGYGALAALLTDYCKHRHLPGPVLLLEGGYSLQGLAESVEACLTQLLAVDLTKPEGDAPPATLALLNDLRKRHGLGA